MSGAVITSHDFFRRPRSEVYTEKDVDLSPSQAVINSAESKLHIVISLGDKEYALDSEIVETVIDLNRIHPLPGDPPPGLRGLINFRGRIIPAIGLGRILGCEDDEQSSRAVVISSNRGPLALIVKSTLGALRLVDSEILSSSLDPLVRGGAFRGSHLVSVIAVQILQQKIEEMLW